MKVVYDTCLYIDLLRASLRLDLFVDRNHIRYLSPIVIMELMAGAHKTQGKNIIDKLIAPYIQSHRAINLDTNHYYAAGLCASQIRLHNQWNNHKHMSHDILIALSAKSIGATLYTRNKKDFQIINQFVKCKVEYVE